MMEMLGWMIFGAAAGACLMFTWAGILFGNLQGFVDANNRMLREAQEKLRQIAALLADIREHLITPGDAADD